ncbi:MAG TPA: metallophosphoesterase [Blastocatellia bacterium]|nr:metallophosphoesterase [Blastocatellia bacterium]
MSITETIITYRQISKALTGNESTTGNVLNQSAPDPNESARMLAGFAAALKKLEEEDKNPGVLVSPDHRVASLLQAFLAERANEEGKLEELPMGGKEAKFDEKDWLGWAGSFFTWWRKIKPHEFLNASPDPDPFENQTRVALLGDWGTGLYGAPVCARSIESDPKGYKLAIHLGDVYYAGNKGEVQERFLDLWPKNNVATNRAINSNHEMYTGGHAYYQLTLPKFNQPASYFAFQNDHWVLVGLDSAYIDHDLMGDQVEWLRNIINQAGDRKVILMSHHQPISRLESQGPKLVEKLGEFLTAKKIFAWYWGHEHRCMLYDQHPNWGMFGRTVGHSGFPYFRDDVSGATAEPGLPGWHRLGAKDLVPGGLLLDGPNQFVKDHEDKYGPNGYMFLEFDGPHLNEIVQEPDGKVIYDRQLV